MKNAIVFLYIITSVNSLLIIGILIGALFILPSFALSVTQGASEQLIKNIIEISDQRYIQR